MQLLVFPLWLIPTFSEHFIEYFVLIPSQPLKRSSTQTLQALHSWNRINKINKHFQRVTKKSAPCRTGKFCSFKWHVQFTRAAFSCLREIFTGLLWRPTMWLKKENTFRNTQMSQWSYLEDSAAGLWNLEPHDWPTVLSTNQSIPQIPKFSFTLTDLKIRVTNFVVILFVKFLNVNSNVKKLISFLIGVCEEKDKNTFFYCLC